MKDPGRDSTQFAGRTPRAISNWLKVALCAAIGVILLVLVTWRDQQARIAPPPVAPTQVTQAPPPAAHARTGIAFHWNGANLVCWYLYDETGTKCLSPTGQVNKWFCDAGKTDAQDAAPGRYMVKVDSIGYQLIPVTVNTGQISHVTPPVGRVTFHWNGSNLVKWYLCDQSAVKILSPQGQISVWYCEPGKADVHDVFPGAYSEKVDAIGYQPIPIIVADGKSTDLTKP